MKACPNKSLPEWKNFEKTFGENNTWKIWLKNDSTLPTEKVGAFQLFMDADSKTASELLQNYLPQTVKENLTYNSDLNKLIEQADEKIFDAPAFLKWAVANTNMDRKDVSTTEDVETETPMSIISSVPEGNLNPVENVVRILQGARADEILNKYADRLSKQTNTPYAVVSEEEARVMLSQANKEYNGQAGYFYGGQVFFVEGKYDLNTVFHEFAHPVVLGIKVKNEALFNKLYAELEATPEGKAIIDTLDTTDPETFKEEVIVKALEKEGARLREAQVKKGALQTPVSKSFLEVINKVLYAIKQELRKIFGKVKVDKLGLNTTLNDLATMLENENFEILTPYVTDTELVRFATENKKIADEITSAVENDEVRKKYLQAVINNFWRLGRLQAKQVKSPAFKDVRKDLHDDELGGGLLNTLLNTLRPVKSLNLTPEQLERFEKQTVAQQSIGLINSVFIMDKFVKKLVDFLDNVQKNNKDDKDSLIKAEYYNKLLSESESFINESIQHLDKAGLDYNTDIYATLMRVKGQIETGQRKYKDIQQKSSANVIYDMIKDVAADIEKKYADRIKELEANPKPQDPAWVAALKEAKENKDKFVVDKAKIDRLLKGEEGDANFWASMFTSYTSNPDPAIGAFAMFVKNNMAKIQSEYIKRENELNNELSPLLDKAGITGQNVEKEFSQVVMQDSTYEYVDGLLKERKVYTLLSPVKDYRWTIRRLEEDVKDARESGDREKIRAAYKALNDHLTKWFNQEYKQEFYEAQNKIFETEAGVEGWKQMHDILDEIKKVKNLSFSEYDAFMYYNDEDVLWQKYKELFSLHDSFGNLKSDESVDGKPSDLAIAKALRDHRNRTKKYYKYIEIEGAFETALNSFEQNLDAREPDLSPEERKAKIDKWILQNTTRGFTPEYYEFVGYQYEQLKKLTAQLPEAIQKKYNFSEMFFNITSMLSSEKDEYGQPVVAEDFSVGMKEQKFNKIREIQETINELRQEFDLESGLSLQELADYQYYSDLIDEYEIDPSVIITQTDINNFQALRQKRHSAEALAISKIGREISGIMNILTSVAGKVPTKQYLEIFNNYVPLLGIEPLDEKTAGKILKREEAESLMDMDSTFKNWFLKSHVKVYFVNRKTNTVDYRYQRVAAFSVSQPKDPKYKLTTTLKRIDPATGKPMVIDGAPNLKYRMRVVKNEYRTIPLGISSQEKYDNYVGKVIDNKGNFLPKTKEQLLEEGAPLDSPYINHDYYRLRDEKPDQFALLETLKKFHLESQRGINYGSKLYLDIPRYRINDNLEALQRGVVTRQARQRTEAVLGSIMSLIKKRNVADANQTSVLPGDYESGLSNANLEEETESLEALQSIQFGSAAERLPIEGISKMAVEDTSLDIVTSIKRYALSAEKQKVLISIDPIAKAMINTVKENDIKNMQAIQDAQKTSRNLVANKESGAKDYSYRYKTMQAFYDREFKGQIFNEKHLDSLNKVTGGIMRAASFNYFALNLPSAIKNYWGILWQLNIEAAAGQYINFRSLGKGKVWAKKAMVEWSTSIYGTERNTLNIQLIKHFEPMQGKYEDSQAGRNTRNFLKDFVSLSWLYSPRKFMEMEGALQLFGGMMYHELLDREVNGVKTKIPYAEAFDFNEKTGNITLKSGIDPSYDIGGENFLKIRNRMHEKAKDLNGSFSKFDRPQAQGHFAYRLFMFMRGYFTDMFMHRFAKRRVNYLLGEDRMGYYVESTLTIAKMIRTLGKHINYLSFSEKRALFKMLSDMSQIAISAFIVAVLFGYDEDDPDRFAKMRERSGPLGSDDFDPTGFLANHALTLLVKTQNENESFIPLPEFGLTDYVKMANAGSIAFNPTIKSYAKILTDIALHAAPGENASLYYKRDVGPYPWQEKESAKIWNHILYTVGLTGSDIDPEKAMKGYESVSRQI